MKRSPRRSTLFPYTTLFRSLDGEPQRGPRSRRAVHTHHDAWPPRLRLVDVFGLLGHVGLLEPAVRGRRCPRTTGTTEHARRSEEHTSELQSRQYLVCRLLLE